MRLDSWLDACVRCQIGCIRARSLLRVRTTYAVNVRRKVSDHFRTNCDTDRHFVGVLLFGETANRRRIKSALKLLGRRKNDSVSSSGPVATFIWRRRIYIWLLLSLTVAMAAGIQVGKLTKSTGDGRKTIDRSVLLYIHPQTAITTNCVFQNETPRSRPLRLMRNTWPSRCKTRIQTQGRSQEFTKGTNKGV